MNDRLYRSVDDRMIAGVCGGLAVRFAVDPSLVRVLWAILALVTGIFPLLIVYVVMAAVVPEDPRGFAGGWPSPTPPGDGTPPDATFAPTPPMAPGEPGGPASPTGAGATMAGAPPPVAPAPTWYQGPPPATPRERRARNPLPAAIGGLVLVTLGVYFLVRDWITVDWGVVGAAGLVALGVVVMLAAFRPRR
jgi:phage shock protein PspC (stress-responsive transcriptional regulator)